jgi:hypothetical protein
MQVKANEVGGACGTHEERKVYKVLVGKPEGKNHWEDQGVGGKMGSEWILGRLACGGVWIGFDCLRTETGGGLL